MGDSDENSSLIPPISPVSGPEEVLLEVNYRSNTRTKRSGLAGHSSGGEEGGYGDGDEDEGGSSGSSSYHLESDAVTDAGLPVGNGDEEGEGTEEGTVGYLSDEVDNGLDLQLPSSPLTLTTATTIPPAPSSATTSTTPPPPSPLSAPHTTSTPATSLPASDAAAFSYEDGAADFYAPCWVWDKRSLCLWRLQVPLHVVR